MVEQMKMTGPWFVIVKEGPHLDESRSEYVRTQYSVFSADDQQDAMRIATEKALRPTYVGGKVYIAQALVEVQPQMAVTQLITPVGPDLEADAALADSIPEAAEPVQEEETTDVASGQPMS